MARPLQALLALTTVLLLLLLLGGDRLVAASYDSCWRGDSDCPTDCTPYGNGTENFDTFIWLGIGGTGNRTQFAANMMAAEDYMKQFDGVRSLDGSLLLHTTLNYFCWYVRSLSLSFMVRVCGRADCMAESGRRRTRTRTPTRAVVVCWCDGSHTQEEKETIKRVMATMPWSEFSVGYASATCNVGANESYASVIVAADPPTQQTLFAFVRRIEAAVEAAGVKINHPRVQEFHSTLGQVTLDYPIDDVIAELNRRFPSFTPEQPIEVQFILGPDSEFILPRS